MEFSALLNDVGNSQTLTIPASWGQGRTVFGGLSAALVYEAMRLKVKEERPVRSLAITFVGPLLVDQPISLEVEVLREGKSVSQLLGRAVQAGEVKVLIQGSFGHARASAVKVSGLVAPAYSPWHEIPEARFKPEKLPAFVRYLGVRWVEGDPPLSQSEGRRIGGWVRLRECVKEAIQVPHLLALVDAWPPATLSHLAEPAPSSSLTWTIEFIHPLPALTTEDFFAYQAHIEYAADGYGHIAANLWDDSGNLLALSRQVVTIFG